MRIIYLTVCLGLCLVVFTPMLDAQQDEPITPANAAQLAELGRANFLLEPRLAVDGLALSPDGHTLALATAEGVHLVEMGAFLSSGMTDGAIGSESMALKPSIPFQKLRFSPDGNHIVALRGNAQPPVSLYIWQTDQADPLQGYDRRPGQYYQSLLFRPGTSWLYMSYFFDPLRLSQAGNRVASGGYGRVPVSALRPFELFSQSQENTQFILKSFKADGSQLYFVAEELEMQTTRHHVLDIETGEEIAPIFTGPPEAIVSPDWSHAAWRDDTTLLLRDIDAGTTSAIAVDADVLTHLGFSPDSALLVGATFTGEFSSLRLWDVASGAEVAVLSLGDADVLNVFFTPDMTRLIVRVAAAMPLEPTPEQLVVWHIPE